MLLVPVVCSDTLRNARNGTKNTKHGEICGNVTFYPLISQWYYTNLTWYYTGLTLQIFRYYVYNVIHILADNVCKLYTLLNYSFSFTTRFDNHNQFTGYDLYMLFAAAKYAKKTCHFFIGPYWIILDHLLPQIRWQSQTEMKCQINLRQPIPNDNFLCLSAYYDSVMTDIWPCQ